MLEKLKSEWRAFSVRHKLDRSFVTVALITVSMNDLGHALIEAAFSFSLSGAVKALLHFCLIASITYGVWKFIPSKEVKNDAQHETIAAQRTV